jgi:hypothetical protein
MCLMDFKAAPPLRRQVSTYSLAELVMAIAIVALVLDGMTVAYTQTTHCAQWTGCSLAAQALASQQLEQARSAVWDPSISISKNELTNLNLSSWSYSGGVLTGYTWTNLDIPISSTNAERATNYVTVRMLYLNGIASPLARCLFASRRAFWNSACSPIPTNLPMESIYFIRSS